MLWIRVVTIVPIPVVLKTEENLLPRLELQTSIQNALCSSRTSPVNSPRHGVAILSKFHPSSVLPKHSSFASPQSSKSSSPLSPPGPPRKPQAHKHTNPNFAFPFRSRINIRHNTFPLRSHARAERAQAENAASRSGTRHSRILC